MTAVWPLYCPKVIYNLHCWVHFPVALASWSLQPVWAFCEEISPLCPTVDIKKLGLCCLQLTWRNQASVSSFAWVILHVISVLFSPFVIIIFIILTDCWHIHKDTVVFSISLPHVSLSKIYSHCPRYIIISFTPDIYSVVHSVSLLHLYLTFLHIGPLYLIFLYLTVVAFPVL